MNIDSVALGDNSRAKYGRSRLSRLATIIAFAIISTQLAGCCNVPKPDLFDGALMDRAFGCYRDKVWAKRACNLRYSNCNRPYGSHFQSGFEAGYESICKGGDGYVPATPPECYWGFDYQTPDGAQCVNAWFEGFPSGVAAAKRDRAGTYRDVYVSRMIQSAMAQESTPKKAPSDVPVVNPETPGVVPIQQQTSYDSPTGSMVESVFELNENYSVSPTSYDYDAGR